MYQLLHFLSIHWLLSSLFLLLLALIAYIEIQGSATTKLKLSNQTVIQLLNSENALLVDVRDRHAYVSGHIIKAIQVSASELADNKKLATHKQQPIILVCSDGMQSPALVATLLKQGFAKVYYLAGGMAGWKTDNLPTVK